MPLCGLRSGLTLLLAASVLFSGVTPPAVRHAHADGDLAHDHSQTVADVSADSHGHGHSHRHDSGDHADAANGVAAHSHRMLLGFDVCLPRGEHQDVPDGNDVDGHRRTLARQLDSETVKVSGPAVKWLFASLPSLQLSSPALLAVPFVLSSQSELASLPLCDSARGERSGVQLI